jgi:hypothetical protein
MAASCSKKMKNTSCKNPVNLPIGLIFLFVAIFVSQRWVAAVSELFELEGRDFEIKNFTY